MSKKIKVLHIISSMGAGGAEKLLDEMLPILNCKKNIKVELMILSSKDNIFLNKIKNTDIKVVYAPVNNPRSFRNIKYIYKYVKENNVDIVHSHLFPDKYFVAVASLFLKKHDVKYITTEHNTHNRRREISFLKHIEKIIYHLYDKVISITDDTQKNLVTWLNPSQKDIEKFKVINNGVNIKEFQYAKAYKKEELDASFNAKTKLLCMVGSFTNQKDQTTIIQSLKYLPESVKLVLVGQGPRKEELMKEAKNLKVMDRVIFLGVRTDVPRIYKTIDIGIVSSNWEGFGLVAVEAMAAGKPVIASDIQGLSKIVRNYGLLFKNGDAKGLAKIIIGLLESSEEIDRISRRCIKRSKEFDIKKMFEKYLLEYFDLLDET